MGVLGSGFEDQIARRREQKKSESKLSEEEGTDENEDDHVVGDESTFRGRVYNFLHRQQSPVYKHYTFVYHSLIVGCALTFMLDSVIEVSQGWHTLLRCFQFFAFLFFALEYILAMYSAPENPKYRGHRGLLKYGLNFFRLVDLFSIFPYWVGLTAFPGNLPGLFLLLKILHFEKHSNAFTLFDDVLRENWDVLVVTGFSASLLWVLFSSILYFTGKLIHY